MVLNKGSSRDCMEKPHISNPTNAHDPLNISNDNDYARTQRKGKALENGAEYICNTVRNVVGWPRQ
jgi:hypothetical protein